MNYVVDLITLSDMRDDIIGESIREFLQVVCDVLDCHCQWLLQFLFVGFKIFSQRR
jgi:hypothetical protein